ncbi:acetolactate decarboxylase [Spiroplasma endosymbiont of Aspidapion aeneum]|uniref:acetolactate decarboxylase n=1 Tax=Spiroplasma endosymbiont of Aspidapion aeneum TaxID=3066276 RepID=UPI00313ECD6C
MKNKLFQVSTIASLACGNYNSKFKVSDLLKEGNFGLGTFDSLDGEMVIIDGKCFQLLSDGSINNNTTSLFTPYASIVNFLKKDELIFNNITFDELKSNLQEYINNKNKHFLYYFKVSGDFVTLKNRVPNKQEKPYKKLKEAVEDQSIFKFANEEGNLVGFWSPSEYKDILVNGFHFHFINKDRKKGGHVIDFTSKEIRIELAWGTVLNLFIRDEDFTMDYDLDLIQSEIKKAEGE